MSSIFSWYVFIN
uniref:Uncharacterized protein n=1 Tax=Arundo donax TaxID=35708 RepID=A0A0A8Y044_ARUDO